MVDEDMKARRVENLSGIVVLSLPSIISTGFFLILVVANRILGGSAASAAPDEPHALQIVGVYLFLAIYFACYWGGHVCPLFLLLATQQAVELTRLIGLRSRRATWAWIFVVLGVLASAIFWGWLRRLDELQLDL